MNGQSTTNDEERLLAALAHAAIIMTPLGPLAGIFIYLTQKEKAAFAAWQGLQAALYQLFGLLAFLLLWACWGFFYTLSFLPLIASPEKYNDSPPAIFWVSLVSMLCPLLLMGLWGLYGLAGAWRCWQGRDFRYALLGSLVAARFPAQAPPTS